MHTCTHAHMHMYSFVCTYCLHNDHISALCLWLTECTHALLMIRMCSAFTHVHALEYIATDKIARAMTIMAFKEQSQVCITSSNFAYIGTLLISDALTSNLQRCYKFQ